MGLEALGYVGIRSNNLEDWAAYATRFLGMQLVDQSRGSLALRMDDRKQRVIVNSGEDEGPSFYGWEVADAAALDEPELVATLRNLVEAIIVHAPAHSDKFTVEIRASLSELMMPGPLVKRTGSGVIDGSGGALLLFTPHQPNLRYLLQSSA